MELHLRLQACITDGRAEKKSEEKKGVSLHAFSPLDMREDSALTFSFQLRISALIFTSKIKDEEKVERK
jgi:hypothetical protein